MPVCCQPDAFVREHARHKALLMGHSMRLERTRACSLKDFQLVMGLHSGHPLFFLECLHLSQFYLLLIFDMFFFSVVGVYVYVLKRFLISGTVLFLRVCACVWVCLEIFCVYEW